MATFHLKIITNLIINDPVLFSPFTTIPGLMMTKFAADQLSIGACETFGGLLHCYHGHPHHTMMHNTFFIWSVFKITNSFFHVSYIASDYV